MSFRRFVFYLLLCALTFAAAPAFAAKGYVVTEEIQAVAGQPTRKVTYVTEFAQRSVEPQKTTVLVMKRSEIKFYEIDDNTRSITDASAMAPMMLMGYMAFLDQDSSGKMCIRKDFAVPTNETKSIGPWKARKIKLTVMGIPTASWYTKDSPDLIGLERMRAKFFAAANAAFMGSASPEAAQRVSGMNRLINGFSEKMIADYGAPVMSEMVMGGHMAVSRVVSIESKDIPDSLFELPAGYKVKAGMPGQD